MGYSIVGPIFSTPLWVIDRLSGSPPQWQERYNIFLLAAVLLIAYVVCSDLCLPGDTPFTDNGKANAGNAARVEGDTAEFESLVFLRFHFSSSSIVLSP
jgi:hypothetical protein